MEDIGVDHDMSCQQIRFPNMTEAIIIVDGHINPDVYRQYIVDSVLAGVLTFSFDDEFRYQECQNNQSYRLCNGTDGCAWFNHMELYHILDIERTGIKVEQWIRQWVKGTRRHGWRTVWVHGTLWSKHKQNHIDRTSLLASWRRPRVYPRVHQFVWLQARETGYWAREPPSPCASPSMKILNGMKRRISSPSHDVYVCRVGEADGANWRSGIYKSNDVDITSVQHGAPPHLFLCMVLWWDWRSRWDCYRDEICTASCNTYINDDFLRGTPTAIGRQGCHHR
jgi:hypothetical protein